MELPGSPAQALLSTVSSTQILVEFYPPVSNGGSQIVGYRIQYDTSDQFDSSGNGPLGEVSVGPSALQGSPPFTAFITQLSTATSYFVRIAAVNAVEEQQVDTDTSAPYFGMNTHWTLTSPASVVTADQPPLAPFAVEVSRVSGSVLRVITTSPERDGGAVLSKLKIEWDTSSTFSSIEGTLPLCSTVQDVANNPLVKELTAVPPVWIFDIGASVSTY